MDTQTTRVQTAFRLTPELLARVKREARKEGISVNRFVERTLEKATELVFPKLPPDFKVDEDFRHMVECIQFRPFTKEELDADPKLAYLVDKFGL
jgi:hypothetical protein